MTAVASDLMSSDVRELSGVPSRLALEHYDPRPIQKVPIERWRSVFTRVGAPARLADLDVATLDDVVEALTRGPLSASLHDLLQILHDMGSARGAHVLNESGIELGLDRGDWPDAVEELAVELWTRAQRDARYRRLLLLAEVALHARGAEARYREFCLSQPRVLTRSKAKMAALREFASLWFTKEKMGSRVRILARPEADRVVFCISHGTRRQYEATFEEDSEGMVGFRPLVCDVVSFESATGRLRVTARSKRVIDLYRRAFGSAFFGDEQSFSERPRYALRPLADALESGFLPAPSIDTEIAGVQLVECLWTLGDGIQHRIRGLNGRDCSRQALRARFNASEDKLVQVTLAFSFRSAGRVERTELVLRTGNQFDCRKPARRDAIEAYLTKIGVRTRDRSPDAGGDGPTSLLAVRTAAQWRPLLGDRVSDAVTMDLLRRVPRTMLEPEGETAGAGTDAVIRVDLSEELTLAQSADDADVHVVLAEEASGLELDSRRLAEILHQELRCDLSVQDLPFRGGHALGPVMVGTTLVRPFLITSPSAASERSAMAFFSAMVGAKGRWIVLLPPGASPDAWVNAVALRTLIPPYGVLRDIVRTLGLDDQVSALERAGGERLVVDTENRLAWLDGVALELTENDQELLVLLARAGTRAMTSTQLAAALCGDADNKDLARKRVQTLTRNVQAQMASAGRTSPEFTKLVRSMKKNDGYRLALEPYLE